MSDLPLSEQDPRRPLSERLLTVLKAWRTEAGVATVLIALVVLWTFVAPNFATSANLVSLLRQSAVVMIIAVGMTMVIIAAEIDLSVGATAGLAGVLFAWLTVEFSSPVWLALAITLAVPALIGVFIGTLRIRWAIPSFITTLGLLTAVRGAGFLISDGISITPLPDGFGVLWNGHLGPVPIPIVVMAIVVAAGWFMLTQTQLGRHIYAIGGDAEAASRYGVNVNRIRVGVFVIVQMLAALGGLIFASRLNAGNATVGQFLELDVIAAVVVGGTSLFGGVGRITGTVLGTLFIATLRNGMVLSGVSPYAFMIAQGLVIVLAVWWSMVQRSPSQKEAAA